jgi:hypothetical protein
MSCLLLVRHSTSNEIGSGRLVLKLSEAISHGISYITTANSFDSAFSAF